MTLLKKRKARHDFIWTNVFVFAGKNILLRLIWSLSFLTFSKFIVWNSVIISSNIWTNNPIFVVKTVFSGRHILRPRFPYFAVWSSVIIWLNIISLNDYFLLIDAISVLPISIYYYSIIIRLNIISRHNHFVVIDVISVLPISVYYYSIK